jgi:glyoxylase-like metal-dependent hydrolase (beta-lactamase superfamily II)
VLVIGFPAQAFATNCYILAPESGEECVIIDPGIGVVEELDEVLREHRLKPAAVLLTHGHLDHVYSVTPVCGARDVPAYIHRDDEYRLKDPISTLDPALVAMLEQQFGQAATWAEPDEVKVLADATSVPIAGLELTVDHAPGHTEGSVMYRLPGEDGPLCLSGDVLFAGSIGRTDLPGGDHAAMQRSLRTKVLPLADETRVLPGHGPATTIGQERASNPYLQGLGLPTASQ